MIIWVIAVDFKNMNPPVMEGLGVLMAVSVGPVVSFLMSFEG